MKVLKILLVVLIAVAGTVGWRWFQYVSNTVSPYDEVGIALNSRMPGPINKWGCDKLHAQFDSALPPYGCQAGNGRQWR
ncbi:hypothetical protein [Bosea minatitlanensis]|uniref:Uncharacterized protein n=1 Tax=Bosea minatitlanensis TaxID=128782 RepID=A0ABW0FBV4_9HYPH|nr:hypothetical protein [Bosea minatitlanensis]MCT4495671.1 hypothetical protein [Bosea minatitlanensis]